MQILINVEDTLVTLNVGIIHDACLFNIEYCETYLFHVHVYFLLVESLKASVGEGALGQVQSL